MLLLRFSHKDWWSRNDPEIAHVLTRSPSRICFQTSDCIFQSMSPAYDIVSSMILNESNLRPSSERALYATRNTWLAQIATLMVP